MKKNKNYWYMRYDHRDFYRDSILYGDQKLDSTEKTKDINFWTNDNSSDDLELDQGKEWKRKESALIRLKKWFKNNKWDILFWVITGLICTWIITLFALYFSHNTDIAVINKDIEYIEEKLDDLKWNKKISDEDYNTINSKLIQIENQAEISKKDIEIIYKEINYIKEKLNWY